MPLLQCRQIQLHIVILNLSIFLQVPVYPPPPSILSSSPKRSGDESQLSSFMSDEMTTTDNEQSSTTSSLENATSDFGPKKIKKKYDDDPTIYE